MLTHVHAANLLLRKTFGKLDREATAFVDVVFVVFVVVVVEIVSKEVYFLTFFNS